MTIDDFSDMSGAAAPRPPGPPPPPGAGGPPTPPGPRPPSGRGISFQGRPDKATWAPADGAKTHGLAIASFVVMFLFMPAAVIMALIARSQIKRSNGALTGEGWANAVLIIFGIALGLLILLSAAVS